MSVYPQQNKSVYKTGGVYSGPNVYDKWGGADNVIGGRTYRTVEIGGKTWLAENLDFEWPGLVVGGSGVPTTPAAWYYDNNASLWGVDGTRKCGLLYNWYSVQYLENHKATLCPGWHVPTKVEWDNLFSAVGGSATAAKQLKAYNVSWATGWNGQDNFGFTIYPGGNYYGAFYDSIYYAYFWTMTLNGSNAYYKLFQNTDNPTEQSFDKRRAMSLRLVHD